MMTNVRRCFSQIGRGAFVLGGLLSIRGAALDDALVLATGFVILAGGLYALILGHIGSA